MTHEELAREVMSRASKLGLLTHYCGAGRQCQGDKGLPDLIIVGPRGVLFRELKTEYGETSSDQDRWGFTLLKADVTLVRSQPPLCDIWRPADLDNGVIDKALKGIGER